MLCAANILIPVFVATKKFGISRFGCFRSGNLADFFLPAFTSDLPVILGVDCQVFDHVPGAIRCERSTEECRKFCTLSPARTCENIGRALLGDKQIAEKMWRLVETNVFTTSGHFQVLSSVIVFVLIIFRVDFSNGDEFDLSHSGRRYSI